MHRTLALIVDRVRTELHSLSFFFLVTAIVISPVVEEIMFRGIVLQELSRLMAFRFSNLATSLLFLLYHIPAWIVRSSSVPAPCPRSRGPHRGV